ncbi:hypothetical protein GCM10011386_07580 [Parapedobacter defluvii]|uniref:ATPase AAA-type core domain-containing protein n=1 Tax=Parapedobacter defluvii TaxID=2045106 RepID=A0ABQ1L504_9SPHI|nr:ATP-binding protein [Parapedobacter defluvii]GGC18110.1 hypothetical protein GCM10011386_07580 [Parapedobacter defluvii]
MLISFAVTNFRSIKERVELDMVKTGLKGFDSNFFKAPNKKKLLKSSVIYGPNASGKSGFLRAFKALEYLVSRSDEFKPDELIEPYEPYRLDVSCLDKPVEIEASFITNGIQYDYTVIYAADRIIEEELNFYPSGARALLFHRIGGQEIKFGDAYRGLKKNLERQVLPNQLFLSKAAVNNVEVLLSPYRFFSNQIRIYPFIQEFRENSLTRLYAKRLAENKDSAFSKRFNALICALDTGISAVEAEEVDWNKVVFPSGIPEEMIKRTKSGFKYDIKTVHYLYDGPKQVGIDKFDVRLESTGTRSLFVVAGIILDVLEEGRVLVVDEFEKNLHPAITQYLIRLFHNDVTNPRNAQLILATHDVTQLSNDTFRRDQVWFTEKNEYGATDLFRCSDLKGIRLNTPLDKWYVSGKFGATPIIDDADFLIAMQEDGSEEG